MEEASCSLVGGWIECHTIALHILGLFINLNSKRKHRRGVLKCIGGLAALGVSGFVFHVLIGLCKHGVAREKA